MKINLLLFRGSERGQTSKLRRNLRRKHVGRHQVLLMEKSTVRCFLSILLMLFLIRVIVSGLVSLGAVLKWMDVYVEYGSMKWLLFIFGLLRTIYT